MNAAQILGLFEVLAIALVFGCTTMMDVEVAGARVPIEPRAWYADALEHAEACTGEHYDFSAIDWYRVDAILTDDGRRLGMWEPPATVLLAEGCEGCWGVVYHELLHVLLQRPHQVGGWEPEIARCETAWQETFGP